MKFNNLIASLAVVVFAGSAFAQTTTRNTRSDAGYGQNRSVASTEYSSMGRNSGWMPSVGFGFGHLDQSGNSDVDGDAASAMLIGSWYFGDYNWVADAGLGVQKQYFRNTDAQPTVGVISLGGRYEFPRRWSIGPVVDALIGTTDQFGSANRYITMLGVQGLKEITFSNDTMVRLGLKYSTEVGVSGQTSNFFGLVAQWGFGANNPTVRDVSLNQ